MTSQEIRQKFLDFFKARGHAIVPSSSLIPDDPSVLLTTAGMQQFKKYYTGEADPMKDFGSKNTASCQKSFRTSDIDEVGDESHLTFFEMLGNFSFGGYFKKEAIEYAHEFITKEMGLTISYVTVFEGMKDIGPPGEVGRASVPKDEESKAIWKSLDPKLDVREEGMDDVFWGPTGSSGPCGPTTEVYCKNGAGQDIEVWNIVFNQYFYPGSREELNSGAAGKKLEPLKTKGVDTGMGLERLVMCVQNKTTIFNTDLFESIFKKIGENIPTSSEVQKRKIADHARASVFLIADGVLPSNKDRGSILRRIIREMSHPEKSQVSIAEIVIENYAGVYPELVKKRDLILKQFKDEEDTLKKIMFKGHKLYREGVDPFTLHTTHGVPMEYIIFYAEIDGKEIDEKALKEKNIQHQEISRAGNTQKFKGGLADTSEKTIKLHTTHHLLLKALQIILGPQVKQRGSNITSERLRMDFSYDGKMTDDQKKEAERIINEKIAEDLPVIRSELAREEAEKLGAEHEFGAKYPDRVSVYSIGPKSATQENPQFDKAFSIEFCGGPHVSHTGEIGKVKIAKEEAVSAGVRRIRAVLSA